MENAFREQVLANQAAILCSITCLYFLVKSEIPHTTNYVKLLKLVEHLGSGSLRVVRNATYISQRTIADFLQVISSVIEDDIIQKMRSSMTIGLMADESTSVSITTELVYMGVW